MENNKLLILAGSAAISFAGGVFFIKYCHAKEDKADRVGKGVAHSRDRQACRPKRVILVRHGESEANIDRKITSLVPDYDLHLTQKGRKQAVDAGLRLREIVGDGSVHFIISPYVRTRETFMGISRAWGGADNVKHHEELLTREQDFGNFDRDDMKEIHKEKKDFGSFFFRFPEGESPTDVYLRASSFLESLYRRWTVSQEENLIVVSHAGFLMNFLMRLFRYTHDDYYNFDMLKNCEIVVLERPADSHSYRIGFTLLEDGEKTLGNLRPKAEGKAEKTATPIWNGDLEAPLVQSSPVRQRTRSSLTLG